MEHINIMRDIMQKEKAREQACKDFTGLYSSHITRPGAAELLAWLKTTDFFKAPAGAKHHGAYHGGLVRHSLNVYYQLLGDYSIRGMEHEAETTAIWACCMTCARWACITKRTRSRLRWKERLNRTFSATRSRWGMGRSLFI